MEKLKFIIFYTWSFYLITVMIFLSGCNTTQTNDVDCVVAPGDATFSYPIDQWNSQRQIPTIIPLENNGWTIQDIDQSFQNPSQIIARNSEQIWILNEKLLMFDKKNKKVDQYFINQGTNETTTQRILLTKDNTLWAVGLTTKNEVILSKYSDMTNQFDKIFDLPFSGGILGLQEGGGGVLWLLIYGEGIISFDPISSVAEKVLPQESIGEEKISSFVVDANNNLWLETYSKDFHDSILFFDTQSKKVTSLSLGINQTSPSNGLLIDNKNQLWISDYAFWKIGTPFPTEDYSGLNMIVRSPVFITERKPFTDYAWRRPRILMQDSQGYIWYTSYGLVRLDPRTGTWCKVMDSDNAQTNIAEDNEGKFWIVLNGKLYVH